MSEKPFLQAVRVLAATAWADGSVDEREAKMIRSMIDVGPLNESEKAAATSWLHTRPPDTIDIVAKLSIDARRDVYMSAVRMAAADGRTVRAERSFLNTLQEKLQIDDKTAADIYDKVQAEAEQANRFAKIYLMPLYTIDHELTSLSMYQGKAMLLVNVASECGATPQYAGLQALQERYGRKGFTVVGFPCNQFGGQEPGTPEEIAAFCETNYKITFPMMDKIEVNGEKRHDIYKVLCEVADANGEAGDVKWNFEKFLVSHNAERVTRFRTSVEPNDPALIAAIQSSLPPATRG